MRWEIYHIMTISLKEVDSIKRREMQKLKWKMEQRQMVALSNQRFWRRILITQDNLRLMVCKRALINGKNCTWWPSRRRTLTRRTGLMMKLKLNKTLTSTLSNPMLTNTRMEEELMLQEPKTSYLHSHLDNCHLKYLSKHRDCKRQKLSHRPFNREKILSQLWSEEESLPPSKLFNMMVLPPGAPAQSPKLDR